MLIPGRGYNSEKYRFAFQGQEKDDEIKGSTGTSYAYKFRMHDPRTGRFWSIDPLTASYPFYSPYSFSGNRVIDMIELEGLEPAKPGRFENDMQKDPNDPDGNYWTWTDNEWIRMGGYMGNIDINADKMSGLDKLLSKTGRSISQFFGWAKDQYIAGDQYLENQKKYTRDTRLDSPSASAGFKGGVTLYQKGANGYPAIQVKGIYGRDLIETSLLSSALNPGYSRLASPRGYSSLLRNQKYSSYNIYSNMFNKISAIRDLASQIDNILNSINNTYWGEGLSSYQLAIYKITKSNEIYNKSRVQSIMVHHIDEWIQIRAQIRGYDSVSIDSETNDTIYYWHRPNGVQKSATGDVQGKDYVWKK